MKRNNFFWLFLLLATVGSFAQMPPQVSGSVSSGGGFGLESGGVKIVTRGGMGEWWKDSEIAKKLQLTDGQISRLDQTFYDHRLKLIDYGAEVEKSDLKLQTLLDADTPNQDQVGSQVDKVLAARGKLEREYTMMNLDLRKVLSLDQWKQLKSIQ